MPLRRIRSPERKRDLRIEQELTVNAPAERVWAFLSDIPTVAQCIPGAEHVEQIDERHVNARIKAKVGPISVTFDCQVVIQRFDGDTMTATAEVTGRDARLGASMRATMEMVLVPNGDSTTLHLVTEANLAGKIAQYGHGIIRQRANAMLEEFGRCVQSRLG